MPITMNGPAATETTIASSAVAPSSTEQQREPGRIAPPVDGRPGRDRPEPGERERRDPREQEHDRLALRLGEEAAAERLPHHAADHRDRGEPRDRDPEHVADAVRIGGESGVRHATDERDRAEPAADIGR